MWLINTHTLKLEFVTNPEDYNYAILSHTWGDEEVTFEDMKNPAIAETKKGYRKILKTCERARNQELDFAWVDTCCIDKSSSAELSESINSMFRWYQLSRVCYAWLEDWDCLDVMEMENCRWFTRGWTLQELIAPYRVEFLDGDWQLRGDKRSLGSQVASITHIDVYVLRSLCKLSDVPVGRRMSWAAKRRTTRVEDRSYSLLGIFDINMPLLYGEGQKAFLRLQEEIAKNTPDLSLFAWEIPDMGKDEDEDEDPQFDYYEEQKFFGAFAPSLDNFQYCGSLVTQKNQFHNLNDFVVSNKGLKIYTSTIRCEIGGRLRTYGMPLWCHREEDASKVLAVPLARAAIGYVRSAYGALASFPTPFAALSTTSGGVLEDEYVSISEPTDAKQILISKTIDWRRSNTIRSDNSRFLKIKLLWRRNTRCFATGFPPALWNEHRTGFHLAGCTEFTGVVIVHVKLDIFVRKPQTVACEFQIVCGYSKEVGGCWATFIPPLSNFKDPEWRLKACAQVLSNFRDSNGIRFVTKLLPFDPEDWSTFSDWSITLGPIDDARINNWNGYQLLRNLILSDSKERNGRFPSRTNLRVDAPIEFWGTEGESALSFNDDDVQPRGYLEVVEDAAKGEMSGEIVLELLSRKEKKLCWWDSRGQVHVSSR